MDFAGLYTHRVALLKVFEIIMFFSSIVRIYFKDHIFLEGSLFDNLFLLNYSRLT